MDLASIIGIIGCLSIMCFGIMDSPEGVGALFNFIHPASMLITFGGSFMCVLAMASSLKEFLNNLMSVKLIMKVPKSDETDTIRKIIELSNVARKEGLLALEEAANEIEDPFLKKGILLIVDGTDPELVRSILDTELNCIEARHNKVIGFWDNLAAMGPAWGMIGTLIGLINMLGELNDINTVGPNMAIALITTFYGSLLANWICAPVSTKLKANNDQEIMMKEVNVEGLLSIQAGENPRVIEEKLKAFLTPLRRSEFNEENKGGE